ncbi:MAG: AraC family transcriptional regulator [Bryobacteraceae bacterium]
MRLNRPPQPALRPFVKAVWLADETSERRRVAVDREHVLPTGEMHLVFRLSDHPVRVFSDSRDAAGKTFGGAVVGGARARFYAKDVTEAACSVGAQLQPGAAHLLFGAPAGELAGSHFRLDDLWGRSAISARERLLEERNPERRLDVLESLLAVRLPKVRGLHPAVAMALERFSETVDVGEVVAESGYSHRRFIALFREALGLPPKLYCRVQRFQRALARIAADKADPWVDLAIASGYSDQSHLSREFLEFAGVTPGEYRESSPRHPNHVAVRKSI